MLVMEEVVEVVVVMVMVATYPWLHTVLPDTPQHFALVGDSEHLIRGGGRVKIGLLLIGKKGVWNPNFLQILRSHSEFVQTPAVGEGQPRIGPVLPKIKVESKVLKIEENKSKCQLKIFRDKFFFFNLR